MVQNSPEYRLKYWVTRSSVHSFARTAHSFACSALLALLTRCVHSFSCSLTSLTSSLVGQWLIRWLFILCFLLFWPTVLCKDTFWLIILLPFSFLLFTVRQMAVWPRIFVGILLAIPAFIAPRPEPQTPGETAPYPSAEMNFVSIVWYRTEKKTGKKPYNKPLSHKLGSGWVSEKSVGTIYSISFKGSKS